MNAYVWIIGAVVGVIPRPFPRTDLHKTLQRIYQVGPAAIGLGWCQFLLYKNFRHKINQVRTAAIIKVPQQLCSVTCQC